MVDGLECPSFSMRDSCFKLRVQPDPSQPHLHMTPASGLKITASVCVCVHCMVFPTVLCVASFCEMAAAVFPHAPPTTPLHISAGCGTCWMWWKLPVPVEKRVCRIIGSMLLSNDHCSRKQNSDDMANVAGGLVGGVIPRRACLPRASVFRNLLIPASTFRHGWGKNGSC